MQRLYEGVPFCSGKVFEGVLSHDDLSLDDLVLAVNLTIVTIISQYDMDSKFLNLVKGWSKKAAENK